MNDRAKEVLEAIYKVPGLQSAKIEDGILYLDFGDEVVDMTEPMAHANPELIRTIVDMDPV